MGRLATIEVGQGPPVLLIHGLNGFKEGWGPLPGALADAGLRAVMVDLPGFGTSPRVRGTSPGRLADAIGPLIDRLGPLALVGHSLGTQVTMIAAAARPALVTRLALMSPWVLTRPRRLPPRSVSDVLQLPVIGRPLARLAIAWIRRSPHRRARAYSTAVADVGGLTRDPAMADLLAEASDRLVEADLRAMVDWAASALALDVRPLAPRLTQPSLVVIGARDRITPPAGADWLAGALPAARALRLERVGHFPHLEDAPRVARALAEHLT